MQNRFQIKRTKKADDRRGLDTSDRGEGTVIGGRIRSATFGGPDQESNADGNADGDADA